MIMANFHIQESFNRVAAIMELLKWAEQEVTKENSVLLAGKETAIFFCLLIQVSVKNALSECKAPSGV